MTANCSSCARVCFCPGLFQSEQQEKPVDCGCYIEKEENDD